MGSERHFNGCSDAAYAWAERIRKVSTRLNAVSESDEWIFNAIALAFDTGYGLAISRASSIDLPPSTRGLDNSGSDAEGTSRGRTT